MTLGEVVKNLENIQDDLVIYIERGSKWSCESQVILAHESENGLVPSNVAAFDMEYFLEVFLAKSVLEDWVASKEDETLTWKKKCDVLLYYALNDAYLPS